MYIQFWRSFKRLDFTPNQKSVNSINLKWNSWVTYLEMALTWIFARFKQLLIGLLQLLFEVSNVFLDLPTFINVSLPTIFQQWPLLLNLLQRINLFSWGVEDDNVFQYLKAYFMYVLILIHVNPFVLEMDAFDFVVGTMFSHLGENKKNHPIGFHSCNFSLSKINYKVHDKEFSSHHGCH